MLIPWADPGLARVGPAWESPGLALAQTNPRVPRVARTNPAWPWDQAGLAIWDRTGVVLGRELRTASSSQGMLEKKKKQANFLLIWQFVTLYYGPFTLCTLHFTR